MTPGSVITTAYGTAVVIGPGAITEPHRPGEPTITRPGLYVRYDKAALNEAGRTRWPGNGPDVYDVVEQNNNEPETA